MSWVCYFNVVETYYWWELPQVSFLSRWKFCCDKHLFFMTNTCLSWQNMSFVVTKVCLSQHIFVATNICHNNSFVTTKIFCGDKHKYFATKVLSRQSYFCHNKRCVLSWQTHVCCNRSFVATKMILVAALADDRDWPCAIQCQCLGLVAYNASDWPCGIQCQWLALWHTMPVSGLVAYNASAWMQGSLNGDAL